MKIKNILLKVYYMGFFRKVEKIIYYLNNKKPWSLGYLTMRQELITKSIESNQNKLLAKGYGYGFDERVVEYPWILSSIPKKANYLFDAGSILNYGYILESKLLKGKDILISNLNPESEYHNDKSISYLYGHYGDLRKTLFKDRIFDVIVCGSVLEHIGMDNSFIYKNDKEFNENRRSDYLEVIKEFNRILKKNGTCLITVPFGKYQNLGWLQVFDIKMINKIIELFEKSETEVTYFKYADSGWTKSNQKLCQNSRYFDVHNNGTFHKNNLAAAESVACIKITKK